MPILLLGGYAIVVTATDIFPNIRIPVAAVIWRYNGHRRRSAIEASYDELRASWGHL